ncbi:hypothetical protein SLA2020_058080 [Shorea laevis]
MEANMSKMICLNGSCGYITQWVEDNVLNHIANETHVGTLWEKLETLYASKTGNNKLFQLKWLINLKYKEGSPISDHVSDFQDIHDRLFDMGVRFDDETGVLNEEVKRINQAASSSTSQLDVLVTKDKGRSKNKGQGRKDKSRSKSRPKHRDLKCHHCDSGVAYHVTPRREFFTSYASSDFGALKMGDDGQIKWKLTKGSFVVARESKSSNLYLMQDSISSGSINVVGKDESSELWHKRLSHLSAKGIDCLAKKEVLSRLKEAKLEKCIHCLVGKQKRVSFKNHPPSRRPDLLELVHSNVCGPLKVRSHGSAHYFVTFNDDHSRKL